MHRLRLLSVNALLPRDDASGQQAKLVTEEELRAEPLAVLRCDPRVFTCPPLFELLLVVLGNALAASRMHYSERVREEPVCPAQYSMEKPASTSTGGGLDGGKGGEGAGGGGGGGAGGSGAEEASRAKQAAQLSPYERAQMLAQDREDVRRTLLDLQTSAAIQMLLEVCDDDAPHWRAEQVDFAFTELVFSLNDMMHIR